MIWSLETHTAIVVLCVTPSVCSVQRDKSSFFNQPLMTRDSLEVYFLLENGAAAHAHFAHSRIQKVFARGCNVGQFDARQGLRSSDCISRGVHCPKRPNRLYLRSVKHSRWLLFSSIRLVCWFVIFFSLGGAFKSLKFESTQLYSLEIILSKCFAVVDTWN